MKNKSFGNLKILLMGAAFCPRGLVGSYCRAFEKLGVNVLPFDPEIRVPKFLQRDLWKEGDCLIDKARREVKAYFLYFLTDKLLRNGALLISLLQEAGFEDVSERNFLDSAIPVIADVERDDRFEMSGCMEGYKH